MSGARPGAGFRLSDFMDRFIPAELQANAEWHRRARMFMLSHVFGPILGNSIPVYMYVTGISRDYRAFVFFFSILLFWVYPFLLRATGRYQLISFVSVQNLIFCGLWACYAYGGMTSPFLPWILIFPLLAFLYLPPRGWVRNALLVQIYGSVALFIALCFSGHIMPETNLGELQTIGMISMASVAIYFAMMSLYFAKMFHEQGQFAKELNALVSTSDNLRNLTAAANQASIAKADFVAGMSHELRTPLNAIIGYSQLLLEEAQDEEDEETVTDIGHVHDAGTHLLGLIDDILTYSRIEAGKMPINATVDTIAHQVASPRANQRLGAVSDRIVLAPEAIEHVQPIATDWTLTNAIVQHLVHGIFAQHPHGTIHINATGAPDNGLRVQFVSRDADGRARPLILHSEIFENEADLSASKYGSTGIEFPLALKIAELLEGSIATTNPDGRTPMLVLFLPSLLQNERLAA
jgi:signal transduction histidine kinase